MCLSNIDSDINYVIFKDKKGGKPIKIFNHKFTATTGDEGGITVADESCTDNNEEFG